MKNLTHMFWMVWNPEGRSPTYRHGSHASAKTEARRLAGLHPGQQFFVLKMEMGFVLPAPEPVEIEIDPIPF